MIGLVSQRGEIVGKWRKTLYTRPSPFPSMILKPFSSGLLKLFIIWKGQPLAVYQTTKFWPGPN